MFQGVLQGSYILVFDQCYINLAFLWCNYDCRISTRRERERERESFSVCYRVVTSWCLTSVI